VIAGNCRIRKIQLIDPVGIRISDNEPNCRERAGEIIAWAGAQLTDSPGSMPYTLLVWSKPAANPGLT